jgi:RNA polymerase sigma factor (sigma-70 family)
LRSCGLPAWQWPIRAWQRSVYTATFKEASTKPANGFGGVEIMARVGTARPAQVSHPQESVQRLREAIERLRPEEREVFLLRQNGELTYERIAELHNRSVHVVKGHMRSALRQLRTVCEEISLGNHALCS